MLQFKIALLPTMLHPPRWKFRKHLIGAAEMETDPETYSKHLVSNVRAFTCFYSRRMELYD